jgi:hypothetical protein
MTNICEFDPNKVEHINYVREVRNGNEKFDLKGMKKLVARIKNGEVRKKESRFSAHFNYVDGKGNVVAMAREIPDTGHYAVFEASTGKYLGHISHVVGTHYYNLFGKHVYWKGRERHAKNEFASRPGKWKKIGHVWASNPNGMSDLVAALQFNDWSSVRDAGEGVFKILGSNGDVLATAYEVGRNEYEVYDSGDEYIGIMKVDGDNDVYFSDTKGKRVYAMDKKITIFKEKTKLERAMGDPRLRDTIASIDYYFPKLEIEMVDYGKWGGTVTRLFNGGGHSDTDGVYVDKRLSVDKMVEQLKVEIPRCLQRREKLGRKKIKKVLRDFEILPLISKYYVDPSFLTGVEATTFRTSVGDHGIDLNWNMSSPGMVAYLKVAIPEFIERKGWPEANSENISEIQAIERVMPEEEPVSVPETELIAGKASDRQAVPSDAFFSDAFETYNTMTAGELLEMAGNKRIVLTNHGNSYNTAADVENWVKSSKTGYRKLLAAVLAYSEAHPGVRLPSLTLINGSTSACPGGPSTCRDVSEQDRDILGLYKAIERSKYKG